MSTHLSAKELRNMQLEDLRKEVREKRQTVAKMHIEVAMRSEKDTARFLREKKELARLLTIENEKVRGEKTPTPPLKTASKKAKLPVSKKSSSTSAA